MIDSKITRKTAILVVTVVLIITAAITVLALMSQGVKNAIAVSNNISTLPSVQAPQESNNSNMRW